MTPSLEPLQLSRGDLLEFLAPGFVHGLGNALLIAHGQSQLLALGAPAAPIAIRDACRRALRGLSVVRALLGDESNNPAAAELFSDLVEQLRVPLRDVGLEVAVADDVPTTATPPGVVVSTVAAVHALCAALPTGYTGRLEIGAAACPGEFILRLRLRAAAGTLPFALDFSRLAAELRDPAWAYDATGLWRAFPDATERTATQEPDVLRDPPMHDLDRNQRLALFRFVCSFAWTDLTISEPERRFVAAMADFYKLDQDEKAQVAGWLRSPPPPEEVDPTMIPQEHRQLFLDAAERMVEVDGEVAEPEQETLELFRELLR